MQSVPRQPPGIRQRPQLVGPQQGQPINGQIPDPEQIQRMQQQQAIDQMSRAMYLKIATERISSGFDMDRTFFMDAWQKCKLAATVPFEDTSEIEPDGRTV